MSHTSNGPTGGRDDGPMGAEQRVQQFAEHAGAQMEQMRTALDELNERTRAFVRDRPGAALVGAFAIGWVIGKIAAKMSR